MSRFRIATFNLENLGGKLGSPEVAERVRVLRPRLEGLEADILCLQEVNAQNHGKQRALEVLDHLLEETPYSDYSRVATTNEAGTKVLDSHNLVILSRFPIRHSRQLWHDLVPPPRCRRVMARPVEDSESEVRWERPILHASIELNDGRQLEVINVHLRAPLAAYIPGQKQSSFVWNRVAGWAEGMYLAAIKQAGQALETRLLVEEFFDAEPGALIAVAGDLNSDESQLPMMTLRADVDDTGNPELAARTLVPLELSIPADRRYTVLHAGRKLMLDHILTSRSLLDRFCDEQIHNELLEDELIAHYAGRVETGSTHAPIVASFSLAAIGH